MTLFCLYFGIGHFSLLAPFSHSSALSLSIRSAYATNTLFSLSPFIERALLASCIPWPLFCLLSHFECFSLDIFVHFLLKHGEQESESKRKCEKELQTVLCDNFELLVQNEHKKKNDEDDDE